MRSIHIFVAALVVVALFSCVNPANHDKKDPPATQSSAEKTATATPFGFSDVAAPGSSTTPTTVSGLKTLFTSNYGGAVANGGQVNTIIVDVRDVVLAAPGSASYKSALGRSISSALNTSINNFNDQLVNFPTAKTASFTTDLSAEDFGNYLQVDTAKADITVSATTFNGGAIAADYANLESAKASSLISFEASLVSLPAGVVKGAKVRYNFGLDASGTLDKSYTAWTPSSPGHVDVKADYKISASLIVSVNDAGNGGVAIIDFNLTHNQDKTYNSADGFGTLFDDLAPAGAGTVELRLYDAAGTLVLHKTYTDSAALLADLNL